MICPHCKKDLKVPNYAWHNADAYSNRVKVVTECCGKMVRISPVRSYSVSKHDGEAIEDDWGTPIGVK